MLVRNQFLKGFSFGSVELGYVLSSFLIWSEKNEKFRIADAYLVSLFCTVRLNERWMGLLG